MAELDTSLARLLKSRTLWAQVAVSMLGKIFNTTRLPLSPERLSPERSILVSVKSGAAAPTAGSSPEVFTGVPLSVTWAIGVS